MAVPAGDSIFESYRRGAELDQLLPVPLRPLAGRRL